MTAIAVAITTSAAFVSAVIGGVVGLVTVAIRREERNHTLTWPAPDRTTYAARALNGVYVRVPGSVRQATTAETRALQPPVPPRLAIAPLVSSVGQPLVTLPRSGSGGLSRIS